MTTPEEGTRAGRGIDRWRAVLMLAVLCVPVFFFRLGSYGIVVHDEAFYHSVAEAMVETGNWLSIDFRGEHRPYDTFMNAPIQYWLRAALIEVFGSNYWTMRVLSASFGAACVLLTWWMLVGWAGRRAAWLAALIQLTTFQFVYLHSARSGVLEPALAFFFALTAHLFARGITERGGFVGHHLCIAMLVNLKLPFAIVPIAAELAYFAIDREARRHILRWLAAGVAIAPLALSWHLFQALALGEPIETVFATMAVQGSGAVGFAARGLDNALYYALVVLYGTFPYALLFPWAIWATLRGAREAHKRDRRDRTPWMLFGLFAASVFLFFAFVSKRSPWYVIPAYPFLSAFAGAWLAGASKRGGIPIWAVAIAAGVLVWVDVGLDSNPFDRFAWPLQARASWFDWAGIGAGVGLPLTVASFGVVGMAMSRALGARAERIWAIGLASLAIGYGGVRVALPLLHTGFTSDPERIRRSLDAATRAGVNVHYPVLVPRGSPIGFEARYYFGRDHRIMRFAPEPGVAVGGYQLYPIKPGPAATQESGSPPNLLLIVIDTLRADHVSAYGYTRPTTPAIDTLARDSIVFSDAMSPAPITIPSMQQMMTGRMLTRRSTPTLAERLRDRGYETVAIVDNPLIELRDTQLDRGFETFFANDILDERAMQQHYKTGTPADVITRRAIRWFDARNGEQPFFAWLHYFDPHDPYSPPHPQSSPFLAETASKWNGDIRRNPVSSKRRAAGVVVTDADRQRIIDLYDSEIRYLDESLADLFAYLRRTGLYDDTVIVLTSDHGEAFGERGKWMHGHSLHQNQLHVPLLIKPASTAPKSREIATPVRLIDLVPTLCQTLEISCEDFAGDRNVLDESYSKVLTMWNFWIAVRDANWKLIFHTKTRQAHLYDLDADPNETNDLSATRPQILARMLARKNALLSAALPPEAMEQSAEQTQQLKALGYIE